MVPPGVSYMPRDFMPTKRFSTRSRRPIPCARPHLDFAVQRADREFKRAFFALTPGTTDGPPLRTAFLLERGVRGDDRCGTLDPPPRALFCMLRARGDVMTQRTSGRTRCGRDAGRRMAYVRSDAKLRPCISRLQEMQRT